jgi:carboxypeptidase C (cathepsin A)
MKYARRSMVALSAALVGFSAFLAAYGQEAPPATAPATTPTNMAASAPAAATRPGIPTFTADAATLSPADKLAESRGSITVGGKPLAYKTVTGYLPLKDDTGKLRANIFFVAYTREAGAAATTPATMPATTTPSTAETEAAKARPITFVFNGGPGSASAWLHLGTAGPYNVQTPRGADVPAPPGKLVENPDTWLADTDLVFIDPVGTGYSRAAAPEQASSFYSVREDIASVAEFIRIYTTRYQRWGSPKFVAGESYGTTRAALLAEHLQAHQGMALNGVILISTVLNFATLAPQEGNDLPYALFLPSYTATAYYHQRLDADLQRDFAKTRAQVEAFAVDVYLPALAKGADLPDDERQTLATRLARYTGLSRDYVLRSNLRIAPDRFEKRLLDFGEEPRIVGRMDTRITALTADPIETGPDFDPALAGYLPLYTAGFSTYVREKLHYENELPYELLSRRIGRWDFGTDGESGFLYVGDNLRNAIQQNPHLKVLVAQGYFDLATPYFATDYTVRHLNLPAPLRSNVRQAYFPGGHMLYHDPASHTKLHEQIAAFIAEAAK